MLLHRAYELKMCCKIVTLNSTQQIPITRFFNLHFKAFSQFWTNEEFWQAEYIVTQCMNTSIELCLRRIEIFPWNASCFMNLKKMKTLRMQYKAKWNVIWKIRPTAIYAHQKIEICSLFLHKNERTEKEEKKEETVQIWTSEIFESIKNLSPFHTKMINRSKRKIYWPK